jgi:hypothetical protein
VPNILIDGPPDGVQLVKVLPNDLDLSKFGTKCRVIMNALACRLYEHLASKLMNRRLITYSRRRDFTVDTSKCVANGGPMVCR